MAVSVESLTQIITGTPAAEASFYSLPYVAALLQCTACAYKSTLCAVTSSTGTNGVFGDSFTECLTRTRLETERRVAGQLRTSLLQEQAAARAREKDGKAHARIDDDAETNTTIQVEDGGSGASGPSPGRHRASSASGGGLNNPSGKFSRRGSRRPSIGSGSRNSLQPGGLTSPSFKGKRESKDGANATATAVDVPMAVKLLREGLTRAFDWPLLSSSLFADGKGQYPQQSPQLLHSSRSEGYGSGGCNSNVRALQLKGLADTLLSRRTLMQVLGNQSSMPTRAASALMSTASPLYMELEDEEGRRDILLEWVEDVLIFALHLNLNTQQTQCLLLDSMLALQMLEGVDSGKDGGGDHVDVNYSAEWERRVAEVLEDVLRTQTCPTVARIIETVQQRQPVVREVPDPVQVAELEQKRLKASTQKALTALDAAQAGIPLVQQTFMEDVSVEVERDATLPAVFSMAEAAAVVEFITRSTVMHRQLWRLVLFGSTTNNHSSNELQLRPVVTVPLCAHVEDVPPLFLPPLAAFCPARLHDELEAQRSLYNKCAAEKTSLFLAKYELPLAELSTEEATARQGLVAAAEHTAADDRDAALTLQECAHVEKAFRLRLHDTVALNTCVSRGGDLVALTAAAGTQVRSKAETAAVTSTPASAASAAPAVSTSASDPVKSKKANSGAVAPTSSANAATKRSVSTSNLLGQLVLSADAAAAVSLPAGTVFSLSEVEKRVGRIAVAAENLAAGGASGAAGRGSQRKR